MTLEIKKSDLLAIAVKEDQYPPEGPPEIAFAGRSNVGKSSLLNLITNRKKLAHVSGNPGKTRTINFYSINDDAFRIVDLPGYGYAKVSRSISEQWGAMIEAYLKSRRTLIKVGLLADIRHKPSAQDIQMYEWLKHYGFEGLIIATKADKISRNQTDKQLALIRSALKADGDAQIYPVSALKRTGVPSLLDALGQFLPASSE